ncbi:hypothetical protein SH580_04385 [Coraliomargarita algicola]|uniref:SIS domain-containing protein n=1 Tax=Coraliomargarita algicola TaxID=3092156 RepID=A0ABZ0RL53_9BACT|nr:hypothetical protein [Coraliomargarita sp. J2-16]WPJ96944.1 hypothetical protein SH580_04385 [Coraliomargarita sp. J2-16]
MVPPSGLDILAARIEQVPQYLQLTWDASLPGHCLLGGIEQVAVTGIGSSEAAAKYLVSLLNRTGVVQAEFLPTAAFYAELPAGCAAKQLVVFTQGLSPNAQIAIAGREHFAGLTLVTSSTVEGQRQAGKVDRAALLERLEREGAMILTHPMEDEFEILPRVIGPICALLAAWQIQQSLSHHGPVVPMQSLLRQVWAAELPDVASLERCAAELLAGTDFYFTNSSSLYAQNLPAKVLETVFCAAPRIRDVFDYAHGPFQADRVRPLNRWIFTSETPAEVDLLTRLQPLLERINPPTIIRSPLAEPFAIFYYERFLNAVVLRAANLAGHDLVNWPGKSEDGEGYALAHAYGSGTAEL